MSKRVFCSKCGSENKSTNNKCDNCGEFLLKPELLEVKTKNRFRELFVDKNKKAIDQITIECYNTVITNIIKMGHAYLDKTIWENNINVSQLSVLDKIELLTQAYAKLSYKSSGANLGYYAYNSITVDDRLYDSQKIATLIHELSHHIFSEIIEEMLMYVWQCNKSNELEAFAWFTIMGSPFVILLNEYCAHTCEGRFIPHGYQNYGSFNNILSKEFNPQKDHDQVDLALVFGNTIARDIIGILEEFIGPELREEIKQQFKEDMFPPRYDQIIQETDAVMSDDAKIQLITDIINSGYLASQNSKMHGHLNYHRSIFREANKF